mmetsp:Transcript_32414/g.78901  ORF Transcript_32414/g.78901 Transcript_32414/m.78901 type:complete len:170 (+) Transcript_32414:279-788(+)
MMDEEERKFRVELNYAARDYGFEDQMQRAKGFMLRHPKEWWCHVLPPGGRRYYLLSTPMGCILLRNGTTETLQLRNRRPEEGIPLDTILDVVLADDSLFVIDALCLGGDTEIWRRPYHDREQLIAVGSKFYTRIYFYVCEKHKRRRERIKFADEQCKTHFSSDRRRQNL